MASIKNLFGRQILDSRGTPTIEVEVITNNDIIGRGAVPSGASTGQFEAVELRDGDKNHYRGKSVHQAVKNINNKIAPALKDQNVLNQAELDQIILDLDGTANKEKLGANAILGVSLAIARAGASETGLPLYNYLGGVGGLTLPVPLMNILNGGGHADNKIDFQEFMIMPVSGNSFSEALKMGAEVFYSLKDVLKRNGHSTNVGDEGGFAPNLQSNEEAIETLLQAVKEAGFEAGKDILIALDAASSEFYDSNKKAYVFAKSTNEEKSDDDMVEYWQNWINQYPIASIEDPLDENDWEGWQKLHKALGERVQLVGDDLFVTNTERLQKGIDMDAANSILVKVNQIGTLTETIDAVNLASRNNMTSIISHRSGETEDAFISDLAVGLNTGQIKTGSLSRSDRIAKYNQLLRIEEDLGNQAVYAGKFFKFV